MKKTPQLRLGNFILILTYFILTCFILTCISTGPALSTANAQMFPHYPITSYFSTRFQAPYWTIEPFISFRSSNPFMVSRFAPAPIFPRPLLATPNRILRKAAQTTFLFPSAFIPSPTALLLSFLFTPPATTTTITVATASAPNALSNNTTANPTLNLNRLISSSTTPVFPGLTSLFLPLLI